MTAPNPKQIRLSASAISAFKACPTRFRLAYREGLRLDTDTDAQRMGTNWHALHEVYQNTYARNTLDNEIEPSDEDAHTHASAAALEAAVEHLNTAYAEIPNTKTETEWEVERQVLLNSFVGYLWYYQEDTIEYLHQELAFDLPLHEPRTGLPIPLSRVVRVGKIDHTIRWQGMVGSLERKSTSRGIDPSSNFWDKAEKDTQVSMYALAFRDLLASGMLPLHITDPGGSGRIGNTLYDVWHKPTIKPTKLTQHDTRMFTQEKGYVGKYHDQTFTVENRADDYENDTPDVWVDGVQTEVTPGKKGFAIRETPAMFGARLLADIQERPEFYFQRKEIARTDNEIEKFRKELFNIYQSMRMMDDSQTYYENEQQCRATFPCSFIPVCYGSGADAVCDGETTPAGFRRIFTDLTVEGDQPDDHD